MKSECAFKNATRTCDPHRLEALRPDPVAGARVEVHEPDGPGDVMQVR